MWPRIKSPVPGFAACVPFVDQQFDVAHAVSIESRTDLEALDPGVVCSLSAEFNVEAWCARLCPVRMSDHRVALFGLAEHVGSDQADELQRRIVAKGYVLATPARYILDAPLLLAVARNQLGATGTQLGTVAHSRSALAAAFQDLLEWGVRHDASDLHLNVHTDESVSEVKYTIGGRYVSPARFRNIPTSMLTDMLAVVWMDIRGGNGALFDPKIEQQGSLLRQVNGKDVVIRWASLAADSGPSVCLRLLVRQVDTTTSSLRDLGYLADQVATIERVMLSEGGAIVFAGAVGSGKSTTLATLISGLPPHRKVITVEDPVEYRIPNAIQNTIVRNLSEAQPAAYASKLRTLKRSAMSDVLLGEIRDHASGRAFMDLASSGVSVYTTVHAPSAAAVPDRLSSDFIAVSRDFLLMPGTLRLIVYQALLPRLCLECSRPISELFGGAAGPDGRHRCGKQWASWLQGIQETFAVDVTPMRLRNPKGCGRCTGTGVAALKGYTGRTVAAELIEPALEPQFIHSLRQRRLDEWLLKHAASISQRGLATGTGWHSAMETAVLKALAGELDPRDIETHFQSFETRRQYGALAQKAYVGTGSGLDNVR